MSAHPFQLSIATVSISGSLDQKLSAIASAGFHGLEIFEQDFIAHDGPPAEISRMIRDAGLELMLFQPFRDFEGLPEPHRSRAFERAKAKFDLMNELGADLMLICSSCHPAALGGIDRAADDLAQLGELAKTYDLRVGYEALAWGRHVDDHRDAWEIVRRSNHDNVGLILDSFHTLGRGINPDTIRKIPGDRIFFVQLADAPAIPMDLLYWSRHFRNMPGEGDLDVAAFTEAVVATGYYGPMSLEIFNDQFRGGSPDTIARDGHRSLVNLLDKVRSKVQETVQGLPTLPARTTPKGFSFIEFAVRGTAKEDLECLLTSLGFQKTGEHVAKNLTLWTHGDIRILLNEEMLGHAAEAWEANGTCVCDIGVTVADTSSTVERAEGLGASPFVQPLGPGELAIPAIKGLGNSVLHFIDEEFERVWEVEFDALKGTDNPSAGLVHIDHLAQTVTYDEMLSWSLFYTSLFEMDKAPMVDVVDPDGLVRSQAIKAANGKVRFTLNGAETLRTLAGSFLADSVARGRHSASIQHIALATRDIFATAAALVALGFEALPISGNYYTDLAARFGIPKEELEKMQSANILFDRDDTGAFLQFYSKPLAGGIFFEIVERQGGYDGYGGPNAPFRIAAQKRLGREGQY